jgi:DNA-directed RNA polymerase subunit beta'
MNNLITALRIRIASPDDIRSWSHGEVKKPETINYKTLKPERDGLFCERIFGPVHDYECACGKYKKVRYKGVICNRCGVEVTTSKVRRERMGHIELAFPVAHIWFVKMVPNPIANLLDMPTKQVERVIYLDAYIVTDVDYKRREEEMETIRETVEMEKQVVAREEEKKLLDVGLEVFERAYEKMLLTDTEFRGLEAVNRTISKRLGRQYENIVVASIGAEAIQKLLKKIDLEEEAKRLRKDIKELTGAKLLKRIKQLQIVEAFRRSKQRPEWMILEVIPVLPPDLRPMVMLQGGRLASADLNDLYRRLINRNNRVKHQIEMGAPVSILTHEKRLLQESVDALLDNGRKQRPLIGPQGRPLRSLSDILRGKEGRFRKNLLGKRVDYSGRAVIVVGPELQLHQCGVPKEMALELFKPFVMRALIEKGYAPSQKSAKKIIERMEPVVWDVLEEVVKEHPVLLNRAPTLHRMSIQAFEPVLIEGKAIQLHPLVCPPYNADFDGDQMAIHIPLSQEAQAEARALMLSTHNIISPAHGDPIIVPTQDIVLGIHYLTKVRKGAKGAYEQTGEIFANPNEAILAWEFGEVDMHAPIKVRLEDGNIADITVGRLLFSEILPEKMRWWDLSKPEVDKKLIRNLIKECHKLYGEERTAKFLDDMKELGFRIATKSGISFSVADLYMPTDRERIIKETEEKAKEIEEAYQQGAILPGEQERLIIDLWRAASEEVTRQLMANADMFNPVVMMAKSGARGSERQIVQLSGMRGLMSDPMDRLIKDLVVSSNFYEGLHLLEYFISTYGARKGLVDTALRTAHAGYLTRRLVDVAQDVIIRIDDCGTVRGLEVGPIKDESGNVIERLAERIKGRCPVEDIINPQTGEVMVKANELITEEMAEEIEKAGVQSVRLRSPITCEAELGVCARCYGADLSTGKLVAKGTAVGIIAAQSIGEPGTQLTLRTFHTGGTAGKTIVDAVGGLTTVRRREAIKTIREDMERGLVDLEGMTSKEATAALQKILKALEIPEKGIHRVEGLFEVSKTLRGEAIIVEKDGVVKDIREERAGLPTVIIHSREKVSEELLGEVLGEDVKDPATGRVILTAGTKLKKEDIRLLLEEYRDSIPEVVTERRYLIPYRGVKLVQIGDEVKAGQRLTRGPVDLNLVLKYQGIQGVYDYMISELQDIYKSQGGVDINDKHFEIIIRQMLRRVKVKDPGDTEFLPGDIVNVDVFNRENKRVAKEGGRIAKGERILSGITEAALASDSFLSAASFQETPQVLAKAAIEGKKDPLIGLKENVIIGRLIPAGTGFSKYLNLIPVPREGS